jgi:hypothetical protein
MARPKNYVVKDPAVRFHSRYTVNATTGCWEWNRRWGHEDRELYPIFYADGRRLYAAHWILENVGRPTDTYNGLFACHHCDNPRCVNPDHLFIGTQKDNIQDAVQKGRFTGRKPGFHHSEETKRKISAATRGKPKRRRQPHWSAHAAANPS